MAGFMQCRHTVPAWHKYVKTAEDAVPIFAGCRLLVKENERASDPRSIACNYWGHQRDCPLFEGTKETANTKPRVAERSVSGDVPVAADEIWPVRAPGAGDSMRLVLIWLGVLSAMLMLLTVGIGFRVLLGKVGPADYLHLVLAAGTMSVVTHVLATLRTWAGR